MFNAELLSDRLARAKLERSRNRETERQQRIFDYKFRTIGVDKEALDMQVKEKKKKEDEAKKEQKAYDADVLHNTRAACILHNRLEKEKRAAEKAIVTYRQQQQQPWHRREYDLNDSDRWKKTHQDDAQMILPGLVGEDPESQSRQQRQRQQLRDWLIQQQVERDAERRQQELEGTRSRLSPLKFTPTNTSSLVHVFLLHFRATSKKDRLMRASSPSSTPAADDGRQIIGMSEIK
uniref:RIB43A domain with coiled-coils 2 n=1 Tax=Salarias fasciatus TaxID=181472 RepID=A0A672HNI5_SALFA